MRQENTNKPVPISGGWGKVGLALPLLWGLFFPGVSSAGTPPFLPATMCPAERYGASLGCTANDVQFAGNPVATAIWDSTGTTQTPIAPGGTVNCNAGDDVILDLEVQVNAGSATRYDLGLFIGNDGGNIMQLGGNASCSNYVFPTSGGWVSGGDGKNPKGFQNLSVPTNVCGDVNASTGISKATFSKVVVACKANATGGLQLPMLITWNVSSSAACTGNTYPVPTSKSKCNSDPNTIIANVIPLAAQYSLSLEKAPPTGTVAAGNTITYTVTATNNGQTNQTGGIVIRDPKVTATTCSTTNPTDGACTVGVPDANSVTCTGLLVNQSCVLAGTHLVTAQEASDGEIVNTAETYSPDVMTPVTATQITPVAQKALLDMVKTASPTSYAKAGDSIIYSYLLKNVGDATLTGPFTVVDDKLGTVSCPASPTSLAPNATVTCETSYTITQADVDDGFVTNLATAQAKDPAGDPVISPVERETITSAADVALSLVKTGSPSTFSAKDQTITYSYLLKNEGAVTLSGPFAVIDDKLGTVSCPATPTSLAPGDTVTCQKAYTTSQTDLNAGFITNTAVAEATDAQGKPVVSPRVRETVQASQTQTLSLVKTAPVGDRTVGSTLTYTVTAVNTGNITQNDVVVSDTKLSNVACVTGSPSCTANQPNNKSITCTVLDPGESCVMTGTYVVQQTDVDAGEIENPAQVVSTQVTTPVIDIETTLLPQTILLDMVKTGSPSTYAQAGDDIAYTYELKNVGNVTLKAPYTVTDNKIAVVTCPPTPTSLLPGESITCSANYEVTQADVDAGSVTNVATAKALDPANGPVVSPVKTETVISQAAPVLSVVKTGNPHTFATVGAVITYSYLLKNEGNVTLSGPFTVNDDKVANVSCPSTTSLAPGASLTCTGTYSTTQLDVDTRSVTNTATVQGRDPQGNPVSRRW